MHTQPFKNKYGSGYDCSVPNTGMHYRVYSYINPGSLQPRTWAILMLQMMATVIQQVMTCGKSAS